MHEFMARKENKITVLPHPSYPQGLALCNLGLLPKLMGRFNDITTLQAKVQDKFAEFQTYPSQNASNVYVTIELTVYRMKH
jgi:hypothetical protein